jgi:undecaprenyl diphosphate synthase
MKQNKIKPINHIAIIMDGNGRWAKSKGKKRSYGHKKGVDALKKITIHCAKIGVKYLTLYAFSTENWARSKEEVSLLMGLLSKFLKSQENVFVDNNIRFKSIGDISKLSLSLQKQITNLEQKTKRNKNLTQFLALNYGARDEIVRAIKKIKDKNIEHKEITETTLSDYLDTNFYNGDKIEKASSVDLLIRTGGEKRLSNFLLWQCSYSELFFSKVMWPDFSIKDFDKICKKFYKRSRRFGTEMSQTSQVIK